MRKTFSELFGEKKPIMGMIHLAGDNRVGRVKRAMKEMELYEEEGVDGAIVEDYHGNASDVYWTLKEVSKNRSNLVVGVNLLRDPHGGFVYAGKMESTNQRYGT